MRKSVTLALAASIMSLLSCKPLDEPGPPPVAGVEETGAETSLTGGDETAMGTAMSDPTADSSGGQVCPDEVVQYECRGWVAALYTRDTDPGHTNPQFYFNGNWNDQVDCVQFNIDYMFIGDTGPDVDQELFAYCKAQCEEALPDYNWPDDPFGDGTWDFWKAVCVFAPNGNHGHVPDQDGVTTSPGTVPEHDATPPGCVNIGVVGGGASYIPQVPYVDADPPAECFMANCAGWDPASRITWNYNPTTKTHTTWIDRNFVDEIYYGAMNELLNCDSGRWKESTTHTWSFDHVGSGEAFYLMGFRSKDYSLRAKRNISTGTWYTITDAPSGLAALADLLPYAASSPGIKLEFRRPKTGGYDTHTMILTSN